MRVAGPFRAHGRGNHRRNRERSRSTNQRVTARISETEQTSVNDRFVGSSPSQIQTCSGIILPVTIPFGISAELVNKQGTHRFRLAIFGWLLTFVLGTSAVVADDENPTNVVPVKVF